MGIACFLKKSARAWKSKAKKFQAGKKSSQCSKLYLSLFNKASMTEMRRAKKLFRSRSCSFYVLREWPQSNKPCEGHRDSAAEIRILQLWTHLISAMMKGPRFLRIAEALLSLLFLNLCRQCLVMLNSLRPHFLICWNNKPSKSSKLRKKKRRRSCFIKNSCSSSHFTHFSCSPQL